MTREDLSALRSALPAAKGDWHTIGTLWIVDDLLLLDLYMCMYDVWCVCHMVLGG